MGGGKTPKDPSECMLLAQTLVILCLKSENLATEEGRGEGGNWSYHVLSRIQTVELSLTQLILSYREKRQGLPRAFQLEAGGGLDLLKLTFSLSIVAERNVVT